MDLRGPRRRAQKHRCRGLLLPPARITDASLVDPSNATRLATASSCGGETASADGAIACERLTGGVVGRSDLSVVSPIGPSRTITPPPPVVALGWVSIKASVASVAYAVIHSAGTGGSSGPYDVEGIVAGTDGLPTSLGHAVPLDWLPDGNLVVGTAPSEYQAPFENRTFDRMVL